MAAAPTESIRSVSGILRDGRIFAPSARISEVARSRMRGRSTNGSGKAPCGRCIGQPVSRRRECRREGGHGRSEASPDPPIENDLVEVIVHQRFVTALGGGESPEEPLLVPGQGEAAGAAELKPPAAVLAHFCERGSHRGSDSVEILAGPPGDIAVRGKAGPWAFGDPPQGPDGQAFAIARFPRRGVCW